MTDYDHPMEFEVKPEHIKLFQRSFIHHSDMAYDGAFAQGYKRPYGNSDIAGDVYEILHDGRSFWEDHEDDEDFDDEMPEALEEELLKLHTELATAVQIFAYTLTIEPGLYRRPNQYQKRVWVKVTA